MFWRGIIESYINNMKTREIGWRNLNFKPHLWKSIFQIFSKYKTWSKASSKLKGKKSLILSNNFIFHLNLYSLSLNSKPLKAWYYFINFTFVLHHLNPSMQGGLWMNLHERCEIQLELNGLIHWTNIYIKYQQDGCLGWTWLKQIK